MQDCEISRLIQVSVAIPHPTINSSLLKADSS